MLRYFIVLSASLLLCSCGTSSDSEEVLESEEVALPAISNVENESAVRKLALPADTLFQMLPSEIAGYKKAGESSSNVDNIGASQFSTARQQYKNSRGEVINIILTDYNAAPALFEGALSFYFSGMKLEEKGRRMESFELHEDIIGWSAIDLEQREFAVFAGYNTRYYLSLHSDDVKDIAVLHHVLENFPFQRLP